MLKPGLHKILIITDETAVIEGDQQRKGLQHRAYWENCAEHHVEKQEWNT